jgi:hypothetical protein
MYCLCVYVYCTMATGWLTNCSSIYHVSYSAKNKTNILHFQNVEVESHEKQGTIWSCSTVKISPQIISHVHSKYYTQLSRRPPLAITVYHWIRFQKCLQPAHCSLDRINKQTSCIPAKYIRNQSSPEMCIRRIPINNPRNIMLQREIYPATRKYV